MRRRPPDNHPRQSPAARVRRALVLHRQRATIPPPNRPAKQLPKTAFRKSQPPRKPRAPNNLQRRVLVRSRQAPRRGRKVRRLRKQLRKHPLRRQVQLPLPRRPRFRAEPLRAPRRNIPRQNNPPNTNPKLRPPPRRVQRMLVRNRSRPQNNPRRRRAVPFRPIGKSRPQRNRRPIPDTRQNFPPVRVQPTHTPRPNQRRKSGRRVIAPQPRRHPAQQSRRLPRASRQQRDFPAAVRGQGLHRGGFVKNRPRPFPRHHRRRAQVAGPRQLRNNRRDFFHQ